MGFLTKKRDADVVTIVSIAAAAVILTFFSSWLYFSSNMEKIESTYETRLEFLRSNSNRMQERNRELEAKLYQIRELLKENEELSRMLGEDEKTE